MCGAFPVSCCSFGICETNLKNGVSRTPRAPTFLVPLHHLVAKTSKSKTETRTIILAVFFPLVCSRPTVMPSSQTKMVLRHVVHGVVYLEPPPYARKSSGHSAVKCDSVGPVFLAPLFVPLSGTGQHLFLAHRTTRRERERRSHCSIFYFFVLRTPIEFVIREAFRQKGRVGCLDSLLNP